MVNTFNMKCWRKFTFIAFYALFYPIQPLTCWKTHKYCRRAHIPSLPVPFHMWLTSVLIPAANAGVLVIVWSGKFSKFYDNKTNIVRCVNNFLLHFLLLFCFSSSLQMVVSSCCLRKWCFAWDSSEPKKKELFCLPCNLNRSKYWWWLIFPVNLIGNFHIKIHQSLEKLKIPFAI